MKSYPFDSEIIGYEADGSPIYDRAADSSVLRRWMKHYFSDGVFRKEDSSIGFAVLQGAGLSVDIQTGACTIQGAIGFEDAVTTLALASPDASYDRIDTIIARLDLDNDVRSIGLYVATGTPSASPIRPELTRNLTVWELGLADVRVRKNSTQIAQGDITDTRLDSARCGICVCPLVSFDTSQFYAQIQGELDRTKQETQNYINEWMELVRDTIDQETAGMLLNKMQESETMLKALINENGFQTYSHSKAGTVHELTLPSGNNNIRFVATAGYESGDTFSVNGEVVNALLMNGSALEETQFATGAVVVCFREGDRLYFAGDGAGKTIGNNLLHNSDFEQWVAQRGISSSHGTSMTYAGDRWILVSGSVTASLNSNSNGYSNVKLNGTIRQHVENPPATGSPFVEMVSGDADISYSNGIVTITSAGGVLKHAGLYAGSHKAAPAYVSKGYAAELLECYRFFMQYVSKVVGLCNSNTCYGGVQLPIRMRVTPTAVNVALETIRVASKSINVTSATIAGLSGVTLSINVKYAETTGIANNVGVWAGSCGLNADLEP